MVLLTTNFGFPLKYLAQGVKLMQIIILSRRTCGHFEKSSFALQNSTNPTGLKTTWSPNVKSKYRIGSVTTSDQGIQFHCCLTPLSFWPTVLNKVILSKGGWLHSIVVSILSSSPSCPKFNSQYSQICYREEKITFAIIN